MTLGEREGSLNQTRSRDDVTVVRRRRFFLPPYYARWIWRANKHCHIEAVTNSLEFYLSTPASNKGNSLQMFIKCGLSPWHIFDPVRLVNDLLLSIMHFQQHTPHMNMMLITAIKLMGKCTKHAVTIWQDIMSKATLTHQEAFNISKCR